MPGAWHRPDMKVVSLYVDQKPEGDQSEERAKEFGFTVYPTIAEALRCGGDKLAVDAVLIIGEHGDYPRNEKGQILYPRYEFFKQCVEVFEKDGRAVPVYQRQAPLLQLRESEVDGGHAAQRLKFPMLAGSSLPVTWRLPDLELPLGCEIEDALMVGDGGSDPMDYHALEAMQCMIERRKGGETGVKAVQMIEGDAVWKAGEQGRWSKKLLTAALSRSDTPQGLTVKDGRTQDLVGNGELPKLVKNPAAYFIEHNDGLTRDAADAQWRGQGFQFRRQGQGNAGDTVDAILPFADAERHLLRLPGEQDRGDVRDRQGALPGRAHADRQRHARKLPHVAPRGPKASRDAPFTSPLPRPGPIPARPRVKV